MKKLFEKLKMEKGRIVSTASLNVMAIEQARASNRIWVDENGFGFVWLPDCEFPTTDEEVRAYEKMIKKYFPLPDNTPIPEWILNQQTRS